MKPARQGAVRAHQEGLGVFTAFGVVVNGHIVDELRPIPT